MMKTMEQKLFKAKKSLGQHFLMHARIAERMANVAEVTPESVVLEIGPGTGMLTRELLKRAKKVIAIEADAELFEKLKTDFADEITSNRLELVHGDIRTFDITSLPRGYELVANIPYYLTGEIFRMFLENPNQPSAMTLLVQKEVAERIARSKKPYSAKATKGKESILSLSVKVFGTPKYEFTIPRGAFRPAPKVDSAVLTVRDISRKNFSSNMPAFAEATAGEKEQQFFALVRAGFAHKRKFVRNNLADAGFSAGDILEKARAEDLSLNDWLTLCR